MNKSSVIINFIVKFNKINIYEFDLKLSPIWCCEPFEIDGPSAQF